MCSPACAAYGNCVNNTCVCNTQFGYGEGMDFHDCALNEDLLEGVWLVCLGLTSFVILVAFLVFAKWIKGGNVDPRKLIAHRNFVLLCGMVVVQFFYALYAILRVFVGSYAFNDYGGTIVYVLADITMLFQTIPLADLCHAALVGLLRAVGIQEDIGERTWRTRVMWMLFVSLPLLPGFAAPALAPLERVKMLQYFEITFLIIGCLACAPLCIAGERAIRLLKSVGTEASRLPQRKIRLLCLNIYVSGILCNVTQIIVATSYVSVFPYQIAFLSTMKAMAICPPVLALVYDHAAIEKKAWPTAAAAKARVPIESTRGSSTTPAGNTIESERTDAPSQLV